MLNKMSNPYLYPQPQKTAKAISVVVRNGLETLGLILWLLLLLFGSVTGWRDCLIEVHN